MDRRGLTDSKDITGHAHEGSRLDFQRSAISAQRLVDAPTLTITSILDQERICTSKIIVYQRVRFSEECTLPAIFLSNSVDGRNVVGISVRVAFLLGFPGALYPVAQ